MCVPSSPFPGLPPAHSSWLTCPPRVFHSCSKLYLRILCHGCTSCSPDCSSSLPYIVCLDQPALFAFDLVLTAMVVLFPDNIQSCTKNRPVISWFSWLFSKLLNSSSSSWSPYPRLMLDPASVYVFLYVLLVSFLLFLTSPNPSSGLTLSSMKLASSTAPLWTSLDLEFPTGSLSVAYMIILSAYTSKPTVVELLLRGVPAPKELTVCLSCLAMLYYFSHASANSSLHLLTVWE